MRPAMLSCCSIIGVKAACSPCSDNYAGALGAAVLANALQKNTALQELYIKGNELGNEGVKALCSALAQREVPFRVLDVGNNR